MAGYTRRWYETPAGRLVEEYYEGRHAPPGPREKRRKVTPAEMEKINYRNKIRKVQLLLMNNFDENDYYTTLTYRREERPADMEECQGQLRKMITWLRRQYRKRGFELKWVANIEQGSKGGWHIHLVINRIEGTDMLLQGAWKYGRAHNVLLYSEGSFRKLANYFAKQAQKKPEAGNRKGFSRSRNLIMPKEKKKLITRPQIWKELPRIPKGYELDRESLYESISSAGFPYRSYILVRTERRLN